MSPVPAVPIRRRDLAAIQRRALRTARAHALDRRPRDVRLWLPLTPFLALLWPLVVLISPLGYRAPRRWRPNPVLAALLLGGLLFSLSGTEVYVDSPQAQVRIKIL